MSTVVEIMTLFDLTLMAIVLVSRRPRPARWSTTASRLCRSATAAPLKLCRRREEELYRAPGVVVSTSGVGFFGCKSKARNTRCWLR